MIEEEPLTAEEQERLFAEAVRHRATHKGGGDAETELYRRGPGVDWYSLIDAKLSSRP
jgi:hypothetical protein